MKVVRNLDEHCFKVGYGALSHRREAAAIVCMSPGNSYFKKNVISDLLYKAADLFEQVVILIPDMPAENTYRALGHEKIKADRLARLKGNNLKNHSRRAIEAVCKQNPSASLIIPDWKSEIEGNSIYQKYRAFIYGLYKKNNEFFQDARHTTALVIKSQIKAEVDLEKAIDLAVNYLLEELAFILASPEIYGVEKIVYIYHRKWPIFKNLINGKYSAPLMHIGFMIIS